MIFKYKVISKSKYKDINLSRWNQTVSHCQSVNVKVPLKPRVIEENKGIKRQKTLNNENQQYLAKRLRTDLSV